MNIELLPLQSKAVEGLLTNIADYDPTTFPFGESSDPEMAKLTGEPKPYLGRLKAVTGAGKTAMLAATTKNLGDAVILWTTQRGAIVDQTTEKLTNDYRHLLPSSAQVIQIHPDLFTTNDWHELLNQKTGTTILTGTIASFNQDQDAERLKIHQGNPSPWQQLLPKQKGGARNRPLWIFYDEGHHATNAQFQRLLQLRPRGILLASANEVSRDLYPLIPGESIDDKTTLLRTRRTTEVQTAEVVKLGLLKSRMEIHDLDQPWPTVLKHAVEKRDYLETISPRPPLACYIADKTIQGIEIWQELLKLGIPSHEIAVHLSGAKQAGIHLQNVGRIEATHDDGLTTSEIRNRGYKHIIWNLSLEEGWDEPWAYVAYFHCHQEKADKIRQRVGRLIRNPHRDENGRPSPAAIQELNTAFFYMRADNDVLTQFIEEFQKEMDTDRYEILHLTDEQHDKPQRMVSAKEQRKVPELFLKADGNKLEELAKKRFQIVRPEERTGPGEEETHTVDIAKGTARKDTREINHSVPAQAEQILKELLRQLDWRLVTSRDSTGGWVDPRIWQKLGLNYEVCFNSSGYETLKEWAQAFVSEVPALLEYSTEPGLDYTVPDFKLINPNGGETPRKQAHYHVHTFKNSLHAQYNGLNELELAVAKAIDKHGLTWARNPVKTGYKIPLKSPLGSTNFYPDFIVWKGSECLLLDPKGSHLLQEAINNKLVPHLDLPQGTSIHLLADGAWQIGRGEIQRDGDNGFTWITDYRGTARAKTFKTIEEGVAAILN